MSAKKLFCFGFGYTCDGLADALRREGEDWQICGTTRDNEKRRFLRHQNIHSFLFDHDHPLEDAAHFLRGVTHILLSSPPGDDGDPVFLTHAADLLKIPTLEWVGYLSSTSVYGDRNGGWADEDAKLRPSNQRGSRRARAEGQWTSLLKGTSFPLHIFRLAGIYGPGRSALDSVRAGIARRIDKPGHAFSRIHVQDIVAALLASMSAPKHEQATAKIYNLADDLAAPSQEVIKYACEMLGIEPPPLLPYEETDMAPITRSFYADNKRIRNDRMKNDLGISLKYPTYKEGLAGCLEREDEYHRRLGDFAAAMAGSGTG